MLKGKLFKVEGGKSWQGQYVFEKNEATDWDMYYKAIAKAGMEGTGYVVQKYKRGDGIKKVLVGKTFSNYLLGDKKYYPMSAKQFCNFTENDKGYNQLMEAA